MRLRLNSAQLGLELGLRLSLAKITKNKKIGREIKIQIFCLDFEKIRLCHKNVRQTAKFQYFEV